MRKNINSRIKSFLMAVIIFMIEITSSYYFVFAEENEQKSSVDNGYSVETEIVSSWDTGYNLRVRIRNDLSTTIHNWGFLFTTKDSIQGYYSAVELSKKEENHLIKNVGYNQDIKPGESIEFGYTAYYERNMDIPEEFFMTSVQEEVNSRDYTVEVIRTNEWNEGGAGSLVIENTSESRIEDWKLSFESDLQIETIWGAVIENNNDGKYVLINEEHNQNIEAGSETVVGFIYRGSFADIEHVSMKHVIVKDYISDVNNSDDNNETNDNNKDQTESDNTIDNNTPIDDEIDTGNGNIGDEADIEVDSDSDGIPDYYEDMIGTDKTKPDTDGDNLSDYEELVKTGSDPTVYDSITVGVSDSDADSDSDGISNKDEIAIGLNPVSNDSDMDGINDGEEDEYGTDPLNEDTDGDTIKDGDELILGFDPINQVTNGIADKEHRIEQQLDEYSEALSIFNKKNEAYKISVDVTSAGLASSELKLTESPYRGTIANDAIVGLVPHIEYGKADTLDRITVRFRLDELNDSGSVTGSSSDNLPDYFNIGEKYSIFYYFDEEGLLLPVETLYDENSKSFYTTTDRVGTFCLIDMEKFMNDHEYFQISDDPAFINVQFILQCAGADKNAFLKERDIITEVFEGLVNKYGEDHVRVSVVRMFYSGEPWYVHRGDGDEIWFSEPQELKCALETLPYSNISSPADAGSTFKSVYYGLDKTIAPQFIFLLQNGAFKCTLFGLSQVEVCRRGVNYSEVLLDEYVYSDEKYKKEVEDGIISVGGFQTILGDGTGGMIIEHIEANTTEAQSKTVYQTITANGWEIVNLDAPLLRYSSTDTDEDGLPDWYEVNTSKIDVSDDGTIQLPTIKECMEMVDKPYVEAGIERFKLYMDKLPIDKVKMLPIKSSPTRVDTDGDNIPDGFVDGMTGCYQFSDPNPLKSDITITELEGGFISVDYKKPDKALADWSELENHGNAASYGGNQHWCGNIYGDDNNGIKDYCKNGWSGNDMEKMGCGVFAAADVLLYQSIVEAKKHGKDIYLDTEKIEIYDLNHIDYNEYMKYIKLVSKYFSMYESPIGGVPGIGFGYDLESGMNNLSTDLGIQETYLWGSYSLNTQNYIKARIEEGHPVAFAYDNLNMSLPVYTQSDDMEFNIYSEVKSHYMCATGFVEYSDDVCHEVGHKTLMIVGIIGRKGYIDFDTYSDRMSITSSIMSSYSYEKE